MEKALVLYVLKSTLRSYNCTSLSEDISSVSMLISSVDGGIEITADKLPLLNRSAETAPWKPTADGKGYHALIEVFHQLHCLVCLPSAHIVMNRISF